MKYLLNHTSFDDMRNSLALMKPQTMAEHKNRIDELNAALKDELSGRKRSSVITLLKSKINQLTRAMEKLES